MKSYIYDNAEKLAKIILEFVRLPKQHSHLSVSTGMIKLPPVFTTDKNYIVNLSEIIKIISEYETDKLTLSKLPDLFKERCGISTNTRTLHNWMNQVSFALRLALIEEAEKENCNNIPESVYQKLYANTKRHFVTRTQGNKYSLKPLRYVPSHIIKCWIHQEYCQKKNWNDKSVFGATPSPSEWEEYGLKGQNKDCNEEIRKQIAKILHTAEQYDNVGQYKTADDLDWHILKISNGLGFFGKL